MSNKKSGSKKMSVFSIWLCSLGIAYLGYLVYENSISLVIGIIALIGFELIRSK